MTSFDQQADCSVQSEILSFDAALGNHKFILFACPCSLHLAVRREGSFVEVHDRQIVSLQIRHFRGEVCSFLGQCDEVLSFLSEAIHRLSVLDVFAVIESAKPEICYQIKVLTFANER